MLSHSIGQSLIKIEDVSLKFGDKVIFHNINAEIKDIIRPGMTQGQVVGFLGPSGIGKTQLFRIIAGLNKPTTGKVTINGTDKEVGPGDVGVVAQNYPLFDNRTLWSNLMLAAQQKEPNRSNCRDKVTFYLELFKLADKWDLYPKKLSGGQRQRAAIIQQLLCSEHFILMDEPFSGLDLIMLEKVADTILKVSNLDELNTIIVVTHDITAAASVSDTLWLMGRDLDTEGKPIQGATIKEMYDLMSLDLCWQPQIITSPRFMDFVGHVKDRFRTL